MDHNYLTMDIKTLSNLQLPIEILSIIISNAGYHINDINGNFDHLLAIKFFSEMRSVSIEIKNIIDKIEIEVSFGKILGLNFGSYLRAINIVDLIVRSFEQTDYNSENCIRIDKKGMNRDNLLISGLEDIEDKSVLHLMIKYHETKTQKNWHVEYSKISACGLKTCRSNLPVYTTDNVYHLVYHLILNEINFTAMPIKKSKKSKKSNSCVLF